MIKVDHRATNDNGWTLFKCIWQTRCWQWSVCMCMLWDEWCQLILVYYITPKASKEKVKNLNQPSILCAAGCNSFFGWIPPLNWDRWENTMKMTTPIPEAPSPQNLGHFDMWLSCLAGYEGGAPIKAQTCSHQRYLPKNGKNEGKDEYDAVMMQYDIYRYQNVWHAFGFYKSIL